MTLLVYLPHDMAVYEILALLDLAHLHAIVELNSAREQLFVKVSFFITTAETVVDKIKAVGPIPTILNFSKHRVEFFPNPL